jgi:hypothetical protein
MTFKVVCQLKPAAEIATERTGGMDQIGDRYEVEMSMPGRDGKLSTI